MEKHPCGLSPQGCFLPFSEGQAASQPPTSMTRTVPSST